MNGAPNVEVFKPFGQAFELMKKILFQPFDLKKWFVIGFAAWLSTIGTGGYNFNLDRREWKNTAVAQNLQSWLGGISRPALITSLIALIVVILIVAIVLAWLRARGRFMFIDCIVKNRGAIAHPWREFRQEGNSYFLFTLIVGVIMTIVITGAAMPFLLPIIRSGTRPHWRDVYVLATIIFWAALLVVLIFTWTLLSHFMVAVMYRRRCRAGEAFRVALSLIATYPGEITFYCLFWIALAIATAMASCVMILATCCVALLPYIGTVIMLPIFLCLRAFGLYFIRQFGPDYDVWLANVETASPPSSIPPPLPS